MDKTILLRVSEPSDLVVGAGVLFDKRSKEQSMYTGVIKREMIDSTKSTTTVDGIYDIFWLNDSTRVVFRDGEYFSINPEDGTGIWIKGEKDYKEFSGKIEWEDINEIQRKTPLVSSTAGNVLLAIVGMALFIFLFIATSDLRDFGS